MKKRLLAIIPLVLLAVTMLYAAYAVESERQLAHEMIRLRVVAASDAPEDQAIKLAVRDRLLETLAESGYEGRDQALIALQQREKELESEVNALLQQTGAAYSAHVSLGNVRYPSCSYEGFSLPAGNYVALTVTLGEGRGKNWWCVLFPPLCYGMAPEKDAIESSAVLWEDDADVEIRLRFRLLDWIEKWKTNRND